MHLHKNISGKFPLHEHYMTATYPPLFTRNSRYGIKTLHVRNFSSKMFAYLKKLKPRIPKTYFPAASKNMHKMCLNVTPGFHQNVYGKGIFFFMNSDI